VLYLEFGVFQGVATRFWSRALTHPQTQLHGFDSFEGLPEKFGPWVDRSFDVQGSLPVIEDKRVQFFKGWFDQVLPGYSVPPHELLVINMDADLYSSTIYVLRYLRPWIKSGALLYFDEMNHLEHEPRAFDEFMKESGLRFRPLCADKSLAFVLFECI
jgi:O-methyltransferase